MKKKCIKKLKKFPSKKAIKNLNTSRKMTKIKNTLTNYFSFYLRASLYRTLRRYQF